MKIKSMTLQNFCKHENLPITFGQKTVISGKNASGKSTIKNAILYALNVRDENGKEIAGIRPHDVNGIDNDEAVTSVVVTVEVDGAENELKKEFYQKKNRQGEYTGENNTDFYIDGVKKSTKKAYDEFVSSVLPNDVCINANVLLAKDTAGRREMLKVFEKHTDDDVIAENSQFEPIKGLLRANTTADLKKSLREKISDRKGRNATDGLEDELKRIQIEIELAEQSKVDIDVAELELHKNALNEQITEVKGKIADTDKQYAEYDKLSNGIMELKFAESDLQRKANEENIKKRKEIEDKISGKRFLINKVERTIRDTESVINGLKDNIVRYTEDLEVTRNEWKTQNERVFDENILVCSYCGQEYPADKKEQLRADFESHKANELKEITERGNNVKKLLDAEKESLAKLEKELPEHQESLSMLNNAIADLEKQLSEIPTNIDISDTDEYKVIQFKIAEAEELLAKMNNAGSIKQALNDELSDLQSQLSEVEKQIAIANKNVEIDEKIADLQTKQRAKAQEIADVEKQLYLLKEFERKKAELLEADVNEYFSFCKVKMFDEYQNGEIKDICEFYVDGTAYSRNLNYSSRLLTEVDICRAFQKLYEVECPILLDNAESIDAGRIPNIPNQLIMFKVAENDLRIEVE